jgi:hypothetical protein
LTKQTKKTKTTKRSKKTAAGSGSGSGGDQGKHPLTLAHVTHEATEQLGGIGTVLEGLMVSPVYQQAVGRSILIGPTSSHITAEPEKRLGEHGKVLYSSIDQIDERGLGTRFRPVEWAFNVAIVYGTRHYDPPGQDRGGEAEVLLIDVFNVNRDRLNVFKLRLWETFGLDSARYEATWDYEEYVRLAEPAFYALRALLGEEDLPCILFSHEFMGLPTALQATLDGGDEFRTVFHAHECATARRLVEDNPGHDTMFYNVMREARQQGLFMDDVFPNLDRFLRHALISRSHLCDGIIAVGDYVKEELQFISRPFAERDVDVVYNGLPAFDVTVEQKNKSRSLLQDYSERLLDYRPDVLMTHVTRPVISKGLWRDAQVCHELDAAFQKTGQTGVLYILTSAGGVRRPQDVASMEQHHNWPRHHRQGFPDLVGPEMGIHQMVEQFNREHQQIQMVLVNQFGWGVERIGRRLPRDMNMAGLRRATDIEFGMATYEPFGISPLEPLGCGALCVISSVCGCDGFVQQATQHEGCDNVIVGDYTRLDGHRSLEQLKAIGQAERDQVETRVAGEIAEQLLDRLPTDDAARKKLLETGQTLVQHMGWDAVCEHQLMPMLERLRRLSPAENEH